MAPPLRKQRAPTGSYAVEFMGYHELPGGPTAFNFDGIRIGRPHRTREIIVIHYTRNGGTARTLSAVRFNGLIQSEASAGGSLGGSSFGLLRFHVPRGHVGQLRLTYNLAVADVCAIMVFRVVQRQAYRSNSADTDPGTVVGGTSYNIDATTIPAGGFLVGAALHANANPNVVTNATQLFDLTEVSGNVRLTGFWTPKSQTASTPSIMVSWTGSASGIGVTWSFDP
jgi:hypothetical protein